MALLPPLKDKKSVKCFKTRSEDFLQLECYSFQRLGGCCYDSLASRDATRKTDALNLGMFDKPRPELVVASKNLENAGWKEFLPDLHHLESGIWREWSGF